MIILAGGGIVLALYYANALVERLLPRHLAKDFQRRFGNPAGARFMRWLPGWAVIETTGRHTGLPRRVPVGGRRVGASFWLVAADPAQAAYVRNIEADPRVRVQVRNRWLPGTASLLPHDDPRRRMLRVNPVNGLYILIAGRDHLSIRVDLD